MFFCATALGKTKVRSKLSTLDAKKAGDRANTSDVGGTLAALPPHFVWPVGGMSHPAIPRLTIYVIIYYIYILYYN